MENLRREKVVILDFGGQYTQLIGRRVREAHVYCEIKPYDFSKEAIREGNYQGIILSGGPYSVYEEDAPKPDAEILELGIPILGICYGAQWLALQSGGNVVTPEKGEYETAKISMEQTSDLFGEKSEVTMLMNHRDEITDPGEEYMIIGRSENGPIAAFRHTEKEIYGVQFHPEVNTDEDGKDLFEQFLYNICHLQGLWRMDQFICESVAKIKEEIGDKKAICAFSGGVDSSVAALLVHRAIGDHLTCVFVDHGLLRKDEADTVKRVFGEEMGMNLVAIDASKRFLEKLKGVTDPEKKRKIIGEEFIRIFEEEAKKIPDAEYLVQGTIYPDIIESGVGGTVIKSHHNVGGLPEDIGFTGLVEPVRELFKDEVRKVGIELSIPEDLVWRQPFPGPGLAVRILGEITEEKTHILQDADAIFREEVKNAGYDKEASQYFAVLTNLRTVGVKGDSRSYDYVLALRAVTTADFMTADWTRLPYDLLENASSRITNEVSHIGRVVYDITAKPPGTVEWE